MNGGYMMIDCTGLDLTDGSTQEIEGIFAQVDTAYKTGKPAYAYGCVFGDYGVMSPIAVMLLPYGSGTYTATASTLQITVTSDDEVTITNLVNSGE